MYPDGQLPYRIMFAVGEVYTSLTFLFGLRGL